MIADGKTVANFLISKVLLYTQRYLGALPATFLIDARRGAVVYRVEDNVTGLSLAVIWTPPDGDSPGSLVREDGQQPPAEMIL